MNKNIYEIFKEAIRQEVREAVADILVKKKEEKKWRDYNKEKEQQSTEDRVYTFKQVINLTGLSRASIYLAMKNSTFPKSFKLGKRKVAWKHKDIEEWINNLVN
jgi:prophage regulatory protein